MSNASEDSETASRAGRSVVLRSSTTQDIRQRLSQLASFLEGLRLGVCILASAAAALIVATYLLLYIVPLPAPPAIPERLDSTKIYDREGRLLYDSAGPA